MKKLTKILLISTLLISFQSSIIFAGNQDLSKVPDPRIYASDIENYAQESLRWKLPSGGYSDTKINLEAAEAGWSAFNVNFGIQGATFTVFEECLGAAFLSKFNNTLSEVGGGLVVLQLVIDLAKGDYKAANINFSKGAVGYAIGKWGTKAMKLGAVGATAVEVYLTTIANAFNQKHDDLYYLALNRYFTKWPTGSRKAREWLDVFEKADVETSEDIDRIIDNYVEERISSEDFFNTVAGQKDSWGIVGVKSGRFINEKEHFKEYVKSILIYPYLQPVLMRLAESSAEEKAEDILSWMTTLQHELNREYTVQGVVKGTENMVKGIKVVIPGFLDTVTNNKGQFTFRFTLYALAKSKFSTPLRIELHRIQKDGSYKRIASKKLLIRNEDRETGLIKGSFELGSGDMIRIVVRSAKNEWVNGTIRGTLELQFDEQSKKAFLVRDYEASREYAKGRPPVSVYHRDTVELVLTSDIQTLKGGIKHANFRNLSTLPKSSGGLITFTANYNPKTGTAQGTYGFFHGQEGGGATLSYEWEGVIME